MATRLRAAALKSVWGSVANCGPCGGSGWPGPLGSARRTMPQFTALGPANRNRASHSLRRRASSPRSTAL